MEIIDVAFDIFLTLIFGLDLILAIINQHREEYDKATFYVAFAILIMLIVLLRN